MVEKDNPPRRPAKMGDVELYTGEELSPLPLHSRENSTITVPGRCLVPGHVGLPDGSPWRSSRLPRHRVLDFMLQDLIGTLADGAPLSLIIKIQICMRIAKGRVAAERTSFEIP